MTTQIINARIDSTLKKEVEMILNRMGLTSAEAIRLYFAQIRNQRRIPFEVCCYEQPNAQTIQAIEDVKNGNHSKVFSSAEELFEDLEI